MFWLRIIHATMEMWEPPNRLQTVQKILFSAQNDLLQFDVLAPGKTSPFSPVILQFKALLDSPHPIRLSLVAVWCTSLTHKTYSTTSQGIPRLHCWSCGCFLPLHFRERCFQRFLFGICIFYHLQTKVLLASLPCHYSNVCSLLTHFCLSAERWMEVLTPSLWPMVAVAWTCNDSGLHSASAAFTSNGTTQ